MKKILLALVVGIFFLQFASAFSWDEGLNEQLTFYYSFSESSGTSVSDYQNNFTGTFINGQDSQWVQGLIGNAISFNGTIAFVNTTFKTNISNTQNFSINFWMKATVGGGAFGYTSDVGIGSENYLHPNPSVSDGKSRLEIRDTKNNQFSTTLSPNITDGTWHMVTFTRDTAEDEFNAYIDGLNIDNETDISTGVFDSLGFAWYIGALNNKGTAGQFYNGLVDEWGYWNKTLNQSEVSTLYNSGVGISPVISQITNFTVNSITYNASTFETGIEDFIMNITINGTETPTNPKFIYDGTTYIGLLTNTAGNNWNLSFSNLQTKLGSGLKQFFFNITLNSTQLSTLITSQSVNPTFFTICNDTYSTPFLNITFKDEDDSSVLNASIPSSTFVYYLGNGTINKTLTYTNTSNNYNYTFCASPTDRNFNVIPEVQYKQGTTYPQRIWNPLVQLYNNTLTTQILYLLSSIEGTQVTFQVINPSGQVLSGVDVTAYRDILGVSTLVSSGTTSDAGTVTFLLNPDFTHTFTFTKSGLTTFTTSFAPTEAEYTITMGSSSTNPNIYFQGIDYSILPSNSFLVNDTVYTFGFNLTSTFWLLDEYGFNLRLANGTVITGSSTTTSGTPLTTTYNTTNQSIVYMDYYWLIEGNYTNATRYWIVQNTLYESYSITTFITDFKSYVASGMFGLDDFGLNLIIFLILFTTVGILSYKYGINSPMMVTTLVFVVVFFFDAVTGLIPNINGVPYIPTFIAGLIWVLAILNEVRR